MCYEMSGTKQRESYEKIWWWMKLLHLGNEKETGRHGGGMRKFRRACKKTKRRRKHGIKQEMKIVKRCTKKIKIKQRRQLQCEGTCV